MMETLNELSRLRDSGFGRPWPRHGLKLLYWFANDCDSFGNDNVMLSKCEPADGDFGFHYFENRYDEYGDQLLPQIDFPYYVVGNLNSPGAEELPEYVSEDNSTDQHNSNTDRVIVSLYEEEWFHRVYVTQHHDRSNYDPNATYRISRGLLMIIRRMSLDTFLEEMDYDPYIQPFLPTPVFNYRPPTTNTVRPNFTAITPSSSDSDDSELERDEDKKTGYYPYIEYVLPTPVTNYRPQTTSTAIPPSSSDPAHNEPPATQNNDTKIQINDNGKTVSLPKPVTNYKPQSTRKVSPEFTVATISCSDPAHNEPPATQNNDTRIQIDDDTSTRQHSANFPKKKGFCKRFCTIL